MKIAKICIASSVFATALGLAQAIRIVRFSNDNRLGWTNQFPSAVITVESSTNLVSGEFTPVLNVLTTGTASEVAIPETTSAAAFYRLQESNGRGIPATMSLVPAGWYLMGYATFPERAIYVDSFFMDQCEVTKAQWDEVREWAITNGYGFDHLGLSGAADRTNHPVQTVSWYDAVKWCNARSERDGLMPAYNTATAVIYRTGQLDVSNNWVRWEANGYRLPTEAEWEKAARGGLGSRQYPWGDELTTNDANLFNSLDPFDNGTTPVAFYRPNGYGLFDMAGNVGEWVWDWYDGAGPLAGSSNAPGPAFGSERLTRGGHWGSDGADLRCAARGLHFTPDYADEHVGLRHGAQAAAACHGGSDPRHRSKPRRRDHVRSDGQRRREWSGRHRPLYGRARRDITRQFRGCAGRSPTGRQLYARLE